MLVQKIPRLADTLALTMLCEGHCLDFSMQSLEVIDDNIECYRTEGESSESMEATMTLMGIYVGEVLRRTLGRGEWSERGDLGLVLSLGHITVNPVGKCMRRLDNGQQDSVTLFANAVFEMANMPAEEVVTRVRTNSEWVVTECKEPTTGEYRGFN